MDFTTVNGLTIPQGNVRLIEQKDNYPTKSGVGKVDFTGSLRNPLSKAVFKGKTSKVTQLIPNGIFDSNGTVWWNYYSYPTTFTLSNGVITLTRQDYVIKELTNKTILPVIGHKYLFLLDYFLHSTSEPIDGNFQIRFGGVRQTTNLVDMTLDDWTEHSWIANATTDIDYLETYCGVGKNESYVSYRNFFLYDLTADFGAGNEPATVEAAKAAYLERGIDITKWQGYYPNGVLLSNDSEWVSHGKNLFDEDAFLASSVFTDMSSTGYLYKKIYLKPNTEYAISCSNTTVPKPLLARMTKDKDEWGTMIGNPGATTNNIPPYRTIETDDTGVLRLLLNTVIADEYNTLYSRAFGHIQIYLASDTDKDVYEPYFNGSKVSLKDIKLNGLGDVQDTYDAISGDCERKFRKIVIDGVNKGKNPQSYTVYGLRGVVIPNVLTENCYRQPGIASNGYVVGLNGSNKQIWIGVDGNRAIYIVGVLDDLGLDTPADYEEYLKTHPLEIVYRLNTPITEHLRKQPLYQQEGVNHIEQVGGSLEDMSIDIAYNKDALWRKFVDNGEEKFFSKHIPTGSGYAKPTVYGHSVPRNQILPASSPVDVTGNGRVVADNAIAAAANEVKFYGKTLKMCQVEKADSSSKTISGITITNNGDGSFTVNGTTTASIQYKTSIEFMPIIGGHKFLIRGCALGGTDAKYSLIAWANNGNDYRVSEYGNGNMFVSQTTDTTISIYMHISSGVTLDNLVFTPQLYDLTEMEQTAIASLTDFKALYHKDYYPQGTYLLSNDSKWTTPVWNQWFPNLTASSDLRMGITYEQKADGSITCNGKTSNEASFLSFYLSNEFGTWKNNNKYLVLGIPDGCGPDTYNFTILEGIKVFNDDIYTSSASASYTTHFVNITIRANVTVNNLVFRPKLIDLTQMYGAGNEPTEITDPRILQIKKYLETHPEYNAGTPLGGTVDLSTIKPNGLGDVQDIVNVVAGNVTRACGERAYQEGDEDDTTVITDGTTTIYPLATPTTETITPQPITLQAGFNQLLQTDGSLTDTKADVNYNATKWTEQIDSSRRYAFMHDGEYSLISNQSSLQVDGTNDNLMDLDIMYGSDRPSTIAQFESMYEADFGTALPTKMPQTYEIVDFKGTGLKVTGKNLFDKNDTEHRFYGYADQTGSGVFLSATNRVIVYIPCKPNTTYTASKIKVMNDDRLCLYACKDVPQIGSAFQKRSTYALIGDVGERAYVTLTTLSDTKYLACWVYWAGNVDDIDSLQLELGSTATDFEPYHATTIPLPSNMRSAGQARDEASLRTDTSKIGVVDLGTLNYIFDSDNDRIYTTALASIAKSPEHWTDRANILCPLYATGIAQYSEWHIGKITMAPTTGAISFPAGSYKSAEAFRSAMSGVPLYYEKATTTTSELDNSLNYVAESGGLEEVIHDGGTSMVADIEYRA